MAVAARNQSAPRPLVERMKTRSRSATTQMVLGLPRVPSRRRVTTCTSWAAVTALAASLVQSGMRPPVFGGDDDDQDDRQAEGQEARGPGERDRRLRAQAR